MYRASISRAGRRADCGEATEEGSLGNALPEYAKLRPRALRSARRQASGKNRGIHSPGGRAGDAFDPKRWLFQQAVEHAPSERTMSPAALQREVDKERPITRFGFRLHPMASNAPPAS